MAPIRTFRLALCALVLLGLTGCSEDIDDPPIVCGVAPAPAPLPLPTGLMMVGQKYTLSITPSSPGGCRTEPTHPTSATAEIDGPGGELVEGQLQLGGPNAPATLQFTPARPGPHHILVAFAQVGGIHQFDLHAVLDSSTTVPRSGLTWRCDSLERTRQGAWVCDAAVLRGESLVRSFSNARLAVAGDVIWAVTSAGIERYVDTGTDLVPSGSLSHAQGAATFLLASEDELVVVHNGSLALYSFSGGTLVTAGAEPWTRPVIPVGAPGPYGVVLREGDQLAVVTREIVNSQSLVHVCPYQLVSSRPRRTSSACTQLTGETIGFEPRVLWTRDPPTMNGNTVHQGLIHRWEWMGGRLVSRGSVSLGAHLRVVITSLQNPSHVPIVAADLGQSFSGRLTAVAAWSAERQAILFEHLDPDVTESHASPAFYWGRVAQTASSEVTRIRLRPQPPIP
jgi:hypothetical protein